MAFQGVSTEGEEEGFAPSTVEGRRPVEAKRNEQSDVLDANRLRVEVEESLSLVLSKSGGGGSVV
jgi:hypothetical protein